MTNIAPRPKKVVLLCAAAACMAGGPVLLRNHPVLLIGWIAIQLVILAVALRELGKSKRPSR